MTTRKADGFALIDIIFVVGMISVLCMIALPKLLLAKQTAGAASAIGSMRAISSAQLTFALTCGGGFYAPGLTVLGTAPAGSPEAFISPNLGSADRVVRSGYIIKMESTPYALAPATCNGLGIGETGQAFKAGAEPTVRENPRWFAVNANGTIWENNGVFYPSMPEIGEPPIGHILK